MTWNFFLWRVWKRMTPNAKNDDKCLNYLPIAFSSKDNFSILFLLFLSRKDSHPNFCPFLLHWLMHGFITPEIGARSWFRVPAVLGILGTREGKFCIGARERERKGTLISRTCENHDNNCTTFTTLSQLAAALPTLISLLLWFIYSSWYTEPTFLKKK